MAAHKKPVCPQCRTEGDIILLDKNNERAMYKCKKCKPYHVFTILNATKGEKCDPAESVSPETEEPVVKTKSKSNIGWLVAAIVIVVLALVYVFFIR